MYVEILLTKLLIKHIFDYFIGMFSTNFYD